VVNVLCPNGHRVTVKVTPTTSVLQVLEEACNKKGFPPNEYGIKSEAGKTLIDLTLQFRFANLPNNAKLELVKAAVPRGIKDVKVSITLQLPDGGRLKPLDMAVDASLWQVIEAFEEQEGNPLTGTDDVEPVVIFMRDQICGTVRLKKTTLKSIGLISGRGLLRLLHRPKQEEPESMETDEKEKTSLGTPAPPLTATLADPLDGVRLSAAQIEAINSISEGYKEYQRQNEGKGGGSSNTAPFSFPAPTRDFLPSVLGPPAPKATPSPPVAIVRPQTQPDFSNFKFPESTTASSASSEFLPSLPDQSTEPCDRETKVFDLNALKAVTKDSGMEVDDSFFEVTIEDLRSRLTDLQRVHNDDSPLLTSAMRERRIEAKFASYTRSLIRVHFPNRIVLQGMFRLKETVKSIYNYVSKNLESRDMDFYLYITPPRQDLKDKSLTLIQAGLAPAANIYFGSQLNSTPILSKECLSNLTNPDAINRSVDQFGVSTVESKTDNSDSLPPPAKRPTTDNKGKTAGGSGGKVPKWFNAGKKK